MKVVLLADVKGTGKKEQIVEVSDGYAHNFLFPRKLAKEATANAIHAIQTAKQAEQHRKDLQKQAALEQAQRMKEMTVTVSVKAGENGRLFGSLTTQEIADALENQHGIAIDKRKIVLADPVKAVGDVVVEVRLYPEISGKLNVHVVAK